MKRFLYATDFSKASENAFAYLKEMVQSTKIFVDMIHVFDIPVAYSTQTPSRAIHGYKKELAEAGLRRLDILMNELNPVNRGQKHVINGIYPSMEIDECAQETQSDMIVMALREDYGILKRLIGNTTAKTIHKSSIPVLAVPAKAQFRTIRQILFPSAISIQSELSQRELEAIDWLSHFSGFLDHPQIELINIVEDRSAIDVDISIKSDSLDNLKLTISHALAVDEGIIEYMKHTQPDLLAFYKPHRTFWERLYRPSKTRHLLYDSNIPLIIFG